MRTLSATTEARVFAETYHDNFLNAGNFELVSYWQNINEPANIKVDPALLNADGTDKTASTAEKNDVNENLRSIGGSIFQMKQSRRMEDDRQRRIAEDERQKKLYGETADMIRGKASEREALVKKREEILERLNQLKALRRQDKDSV